MKITWGHRIAVITAVAALAAIALGALLTSEIRVMPGAAGPSTVTAPGLEEAHRISGYVVAGLTLLTAITVSNLAGWLALAAAAGEIFLAPIPALHAMLAPVYFALLVAVAVLTSDAWQAGPKPVPSQWGPLRPLGICVPLLIVLQVGLGAAFRHNAMGVVWHILNALIVILAILIAAVFVLRQYPDHPTLRPAALALIIIAGIQILLGFTVYMVLLVSSENNIGLIVIGVLHVVNGSLTLAAGLVLCMEMQRNLIQSKV